MDKIRIGTFPHNIGGDCLQDIAIKVNNNFKEVQSLLDSKPEPEPEPEESNIGYIKIINLENKEETLKVLNQYIQDGMNNKLNYVICINLIGSLLPLSYCTNLNDDIIFIGHLDQDSNELLIFKATLIDQKFIDYSYEILELYLNFFDSLNNFSESNSKLFNKLNWYKTLNIKNWFIRDYSNYPSFANLLYYYEGKLVYDNTDKFYFQLGFVIYEVVLNNEEQTYTVNKCDLTGFNLQELNTKIDSKLDASEGSLLTEEEKVLIGTIENKVDKVPGKGLSSNDFTDDYKNKIDSL